MTRLRALVPLAHQLRYHHRIDRAERMVDGDTAELDAAIDIGTTNRDRYRPLGVDAVELRDVLGPAATDWLRAWFRDHPAVTAHVWKRDSFGRRLCYITDDVTGADLATDMRATAYVVARHLEAYR